MIQWDVYRIPVDFRIVRARDDKNYKTENELFREMLEAFTPPYWAEQVIVVGDAAYASNDNIELIKELGYYYVFSLPRTRVFQDGKSLRNLVTHLHRSCFKRLFLPKLTCERKRCFWVYSKAARIRNVGDVTLVLSKIRQTDGPKKTKIIVTNLPNADARTVLAIYQRRWHIELLFKELKGAIGLGQHQVTKDFDRIERSFSVCFMAYLMLIKLRAKDIKSGKPWSAFALKRNLRDEIM